MNPETVDRRKIFTVGMVWMDFVKRLPRTGARFQDQRPQPNPYMNAALQQYAMQQQNLTPEQRATLAQQQYGARYGGSTPFGGLDQFWWQL